MELNRTNSKELLSVQGQIWPPGVLDLGIDDIGGIGHGNLHIGRACLCSGSRLQPGAVKHLQMYSHIVGAVLACSVYSVSDRFRAPAA